MRKTGNFVSQRDAWNVALPHILINIKYSNRVSRPSGILMITKRTRIQRQVCLPNNYGKCTRLPVQGDEAAWSSVSSPSHTTNNPENICETHFIIFFFSSSAYNGKLSASEWTKMFSEISCQLLACVFQQRPTDGPDAVLPAFLWQR